jgi:hypothetical protein
MQRGEKRRDDVADPGELHRRVVVRERHEHASTGDPRRSRAECADRSHPHEPHSGIAQLELLDELLDGHLRLRVVERGLGAELVALGVCRRMSRSGAVGGCRAGMDDAADALTERRAENIVRAVDVHAPRVRTPPEHDEREVDQRIRAGEIMPDLRIANIAPNPADRRIADGRERSPRRPGVDRHHTVDTLVGGERVHNRRPEIARGPGDRDSHVSVRPTCG